MEETYAWQESISNKLVIIDQKGQIDRTIYKNRAILDRIFIFRIWMLLKELLNIKILRETDFLNFSIRPRKCWRWGPGQHNKGKEKHDYQIMCVCEPTVGNFLQKYLKKD